MASTMAIQDPRVSHSRPGFVQSNCRGYVAKGSVLSTTWMGDIRNCEPDIHWKTQATRTPSLSSLPLEEHSSTGAASGSDEETPKGSEELSETRMCHFQQSMGKDRFDACLVVAQKTSPLMERILGQKFASSAVPEIESSNTPGEECLSLTSFSPPPSPPLPSFVKKQLCDSNVRRLGGEKSHWLASSGSDGQSVTCAPISFGHCCCDGAQCNKCHLCSEQRVVARATGQPLDSDRPNYERSALQSKRGKALEDAQHESSRGEGAECWDLEGDRQRSCPMTRAMKVVASSADSSNSMPVNRSFDTLELPPPPPPPEPFLAAVPMRDLSSSLAHKGTAVEQNLRTFCEENCWVADEPTAVDMTSMGSAGHPFSCSLPCRFRWMPLGCKKGAKCVRCHECKWQRRQKAKPMTIVLTKLRTVLAAEQAEHE